MTTTQFYIVFLILFKASCCKAVNNQRNNAAVSVPPTPAPPTTADIRQISEQIWRADSNRINGICVRYNVSGPRLFTYVNEGRFSRGTTYSRFIALFNNYNPMTGIAEVCDVTCQREKDDFLTAIMSTQPIRLLHGWLSRRGLASQTVNGFKEELRQYFFLDYSRSRGPLDSSGFEHVFLGEIQNGVVSGLHNWVKAYLEEKTQSFRYTSHLGTCPNEVIKFSFKYLNYMKMVSTMFIRTSPEVEIALYTLCLRTSIGTSCPMRLNGVNQYMTVFRMANQPLTIGSAFPNC